MPASYPENTRLNQCQPHTQATWEDMSLKQALLLVNVCVFKLIILEVIHMPGEIRDMTTHILASLCCVVC